jgi:hypothetical protein
MSAWPPLLMIAEGRKPRPRKAPLARPKEIVLHMAVAKVLRDHVLETWAWTHIPSGELRSKITAAKLKRMDAKPGWPDFILVAPSGQLHGLELKRIGERLSGPQEEFQSWCIKHAVKHSVAYNFDQALAALGAWQCLRIKIPFGGPR